MFTKACMKENVHIADTHFIMCTSVLFRSGFLPQGHQKVLSRSLWIPHPLHLQIGLAVQALSLSADTALGNRRGRLQNLHGSSRGWHVDDGCEYELSECQNVLSLSSQGPGNQIQFSKWETEGWWLFFLFFFTDPSFSMPQFFRVVLTRSFRVTQIVYTAVVSLELEL